MVAPTQAQVDGNDNNENNTNTTVEDTTETVPLPLVGEPGSIPDGFSNVGLYSCEGGKFGSVGMDRAQGAFVPVSDQAVTTNTNILLYKECILDGVVARLRESLIAQMAKETLEMASGQTTGEPAFITNLAKTRDELKQKVTKEFVESSNTDVICEPFREDIKKTLLLKTDQEINAPEEAYRCNVPSEDAEDFKNFSQGKGRFSKDLYLKYISPQNNPLLVFTTVNDQLESAIEQKINDEFTILGWGNGFKSKTAKRRIPSGNGEFEEVEEIVTPGSVIQEIVTYSSLTGQRQLENADEADELIGSLMSNIHTQILTSVRGLKGIADSINGGLSFLDRIVQDSASRTRDQYISAGSGLLANAIITESEYNTARKASLTRINSAITELQTQDGACWGALVAEAKVDLLSELGIDNGTAVSNMDTEVEFYPEDPIDTQIVTTDIDITASGGGRTTSTTLLRTTKYYLSAIATDILPLLSTVQQDVLDSDTALSMLIDLQSRLAQATTPNETRQILGEVDQLVSSGQLHKTADVYIAQDQHSQILSFMSDLLSETSNIWGQSWCDPTNWRDQVKE